MVVIEPKTSINEISDPKTATAFLITSLCTAKPTTKSRAPIKISATPSNAQEMGIMRVATTTKPISMSTTDTTASILPEVIFILTPLSNV